jgi:hypothetical protein
MLQWRLGAEFVVKSRSLLRLRANVAQHGGMTKVFRGRPRNAVLGRVGGPVHTAWLDATANQGEGALCP